MHPSSILSPRALELLLYWGGELHNKDFPLSPSVDGHMVCIVNYFAYKVNLQPLVRKADN